MLHEYFSPYEQFIYNKIIFFKVYSANFLHVISKTPIICEYVWKNSLKQFIKYM